MKQRQTSLENKSSNNINVCIGSLFAVEVVQGCIKTQINGMFGWSIGEESYKCWYVGLSIGESCKSSVNIGELITIWDSLRNGAILTLICFFIDFKFTVTKAISVMIETVS